MVTAVTVTVFRVFSWFWLTVFYFFPDVVDSSFSEYVDNLLKSLTPLLKRLSRRGKYKGLQGKRLRGKGEEYLSFYCASIPKRLFAYTQTTVRLYAKWNAFQNNGRLISRHSRAGSRGCSTGQNQLKKLVSTCEVLHVLITSIFTNEIVAVISIKKSNQLSEDVFWFIHMQPSILITKIQNQISWLEKSL